MRRSHSLLALLACISVGVSASHAQSVADSFPRAVTNDNRASAGVLKDGVLHVRLVASRATWHPEAEDGPFKVVAAFGEEGKAPSIPGPLLRVRAGTIIDATFTNLLADTLVVLGMRGRADSLRIAPGDSARLRHSHGTAGSFLYAAGELVRGKARFAGSTGQLVGGLIVDAGKPSRDRVVIATGWDPTPTAGLPYFLAMNGKSWPYTEKFEHSVGDTVRWRVLNGGGGSGAHHPMHLHGFYYRVDARGGWDADTLYPAHDRRWVVTENLPGLSSMSMIWIPTRAGNWMFHCHNADHIAGQKRYVIAGRSRPYPAAPMHDAKEHLEWDMAGLAHAITVLPRARATPVATTTAPARRLRLFVNQRNGYYGRQPGFGYVLQQGGVEPRADSVVIPGPALVLRRGQPVEITVINRLETHTSVHWHGMELESFYDGVGGWSGSGDKRAPMIAPGDSFVARFTPPRSGTFIYHAHVNDVVQLGRGLYGPLLVVADERRWKHDANHVAIIGMGRPNGRAQTLVNGSATPAPLRRQKGVKQRLRLINIETENNVVVTMFGDSVPLRWTPVAKDGFSLPPSQRRTRAARVHIFPGETYDFEFDSASDVVEARFENVSGAEREPIATLQIRARR